MSFRTNTPAPVGDGRSRRNFLKSLGLGAGALGLAGTAGVSTAQAQFTNDDLAFLNFTLNLEYLKAEYYCHAVFGQGLQNVGVQVTGSGNLGTVTVKSNPQVTFATPLLREYAEEFAFDKINQVNCLRSLLGGSVIARPSIDLLNSFNQAMSLATGGSFTTFDPFADQINFFLGAFILADVDVTWLKAELRLLTDKSLLDVLAGILAVDGHHAGCIRTVLTWLDRNNPAEDIAAIAEVFSDMRDSLDGAGDIDQGILHGNGTANISPTESNGLVFSRTAVQVLNVFYLSASTTVGGFFPNGINGV